MLSFWWLINHLVSLRRFFSMFWFWRFSFRRFLSFSRFSLRLFFSFRNFVSFTFNRFRLFSFLLTKVRLIWSLNFFGSFNWFSNTFLLFFCRFYCLFLSWRRTSSLLLNFCSVLRLFSIKKIIFLSFWW